MMPAAKRQLRSPVSVRTECLSLLRRRFAPELGGERPAARDHAYPAVAWRRRLGLDLARGPWGEVAQHLHREWPAERKGGRRDFAVCETVGEHPVDAGRAICPPPRVQPGNLAPCPIAQIDHKDDDRIGVSLALGVLVALLDLPRGRPQQVQPIAIALVSSGTLTGCRVSSRCSIHASAVLSEVSVRPPAAVSKRTGWRYDADHRSVTAG